MVPHLLHDGAGHGSECHVLGSVHTVSLACTFEVAIEKTQLVLGIEQLSQLRCQDSRVTPNPCALGDSGLIVHANLHNAILPDRAAPLQCKCWCFGGR